MKSIVYNNTSQYHYNVSAYNTIEIAKLPATCRLQHVLNMLIGPNMFVILVYTHSHIVITTVMSKFSYNKYHFMENYKYVCGCFV